MKKDGLIELENKVTTTRLRVIHYDYFVGKGPEPGVKTYSDDFEKFWKQYHATTVGVVLW